MSDCDPRENLTEEEINELLKGKMTATEQANGFYRFAEYASSRHDKRRDVEWKISVSLWTLLLAPGIFDLRDKIQLPDLIPDYIPIECTSVSFGLILTSGYAFFWLYPLWIANFDDKALADYAWKKAIDITLTGNKTNDTRYPGKSICKQIKFFSYLKCKLSWGELENIELENIELEEKKIVKFSKVCDWAMTFHIATTFILATICCYVFLNVPEEIQVTPTATYEAAILLLEAAKTGLTK